MLSTQSTPSKQMSSPETPRSARSLNPQTPSFVPSSPMRGPGTSNEVLDNWFDGFAQHQSTLQAMAEASTDPKFQEELGTIEQWFKVLSEPERTASIYALIQHSTQTQIRFFIAVLQQMLRAADGPQNDGQQTNSNPRSLRPPSLNLPMPRTPSSAQFSAGLVSADPALGSAAVGEKSKLSQIPEAGEQTLNLSDENSWASMVNTPLGNMFPKGAPGAKSPSQENVNGLPALSLMNGFNGMMGVSQEAQLLAMQLVMSGMVQPGMPLQQQFQNLQNGNKGTPTKTKAAGSATSSHNWRNGQGGRYPRSALKSAGAKSPGMKSAGLSSAGLKSATSMTSAGSRPDDDVDPELLKDVPAWLKGLRLHKYTTCFEGMTWEQMVVLDDAVLEKKGVAALGARRRLLRTFENVRKKMGMEPATASVDGSGEPVATFAAAGPMPSIASVTEPLRKEGAPENESV